MTRLEQPEVNDAFDLMAKSTELPLREYTSITKSQAEIELILAQHLNTFTTVLYGAFSRKTIVSPLHGSIVDMLIVFRKDVKNALPSRVVSKIQEILSEQYPDVYALKNRSVLMLPINGFFYKIQPAYQVAEHTYMLPDISFDDWVKYDISSYNDIFIKQNVRHKGRLIEIIRIVKTWNRVSGNFFNGYYLELMITELLSSHEITSYAETMRYIFKTAVAQVAFRQLDPANLDFEVEGLNDIEDVVKVMKLLQKCFTLANDAVIFEREDNIKQALDNWNQVFPKVFPNQVDMMVGKARSAGIKGADALRMMIDNN